MKKQKSEKRLLTGGNRFVWSEKPTKLFLQLWQENVPYLRGVKTGVQVHKEIAEKMKMYQATHLEIKSKIDNMTKRYKKEVLKYHIKGNKSGWEYFDQVHNILKETKYFNIWASETFDFSPIEDSDSSDSFSWGNNENKSSKKLKTDANEIIAPKIELETASNKSHLSCSSQKSQTPERSPSVKSDVSFKYEDPPLPESYFESESDQLLALEEAKLNIQREELKVMKNMADELSALHREFLKAYKFK